MRGKRLYVGLVVMGLLVPAVLFLVLKLSSYSQFFTLSVTCLLGWGVAHLAGDILTRRRLDGRNNPVNALRQWERREEDRGF